MLAAAVDAASPGGLIVYSTCTVLPAEDDDVVKRVLERRRGVAELDKPTVPLGRSTETGVLIRPDTDGGRGPMFIARLAKRTAN
jgi:16S rRNA C967 or C1407 C5-methylase (RsmB/RsmF family)